MPHPVDDLIDFKSWIKSYNATIGGLPNERQWATILRKIDELEFCTRQHVEYDPGEIYEDEHGNQYWPWGEEMG